MRIGSSTDNYAWSSLQFCEVGDSIVQKIGEVREWPKKLIARKGPVAVNVCQSLAVIDRVKSSTSSSRRNEQAA